MSRFWPLIKLLPIKTNFRFVRYAKLFGSLSVLLVVAWSLPPLKGLLLALNKWALTLGAFYADQVLGIDKTFPLGYIVVARKR